MLSRWPLLHKELGRDCLACVLARPYRISLDSRHFLRSVDGTLKEEEIYLPAFLLNLPNSELVPFPFWLHLLDPLSTTRDVPLLFQWPFIEETSWFQATEPQIGLICTYKKVLTNVTEYIWSSG